MNAVRIALMAKAPLAGLAKTRLAPALGAAGAAALAERMLDHAVAQAVAAALGPVTLWAAPDTSHPAFMRARQQHGVALAQQGAGDIGARMTQVFEQAFAQTATQTPKQAPTPLLLMGTDAPGLDACVLHAAAAALREQAVVFVPTFDGGYVLVGLQAAPAPLLLALFSGMNWSTPQVMADTRQRLAALGVAHTELPALADIDEPADLAHLPVAWVDA